MRRLIAILLMAFCVSWFTPIAYAQTDESVVEKTAPAAVTASEVAAKPVFDSGTADANNVAENGADAEEKASEGIGWSNVAGSALKLLLPLLSLLAVLLGVPYVLKLLKKAGLENTKLAEDILTKLVKMAINWVEGWASSLEKKPSSADKKAAAVKFVLDMAASSGVVGLAEDRISKMVEGQLARDKANAEK